MTAELGMYFVTNSFGDTLPLVIKPKNVESSSVNYLKQWITENQETLDRQLLEYGAILFKGFLVEEGIHFQEVVQSFKKELSNKYRGAAPRELIPGTQFVFSASDLPPRYPVPQHLEMSFLPAPPKYVFFCCLEAPTTLGGETSLCDFKKVYEQLDPKVRDKFETKGVMYIRNYPPKKTYFSEPLLMKGWQAVFETEDKEVVEKELVKSGMNFEWRANGHLCITNKASAVELHPETGEKIWFNQLADFHWSLFHQDYGYIYQRLQQIYYLILSWLMLIIQLFIVAVKGPKNMAMHICFGDGSEIPLADVTHVRNTVYKNMVFNRWEKGDIVMIDNFRVSHGRQPFTGKRKIVVAWSKPQLKPSFRQ